MINNDTLMAVQAVVTRFQAALDAVRAQRKRSWGESYPGSPATAALRRASMDLTRALAELRRSPHA